MNNLNIPTLEYDQGSIVIHNITPELADKIENLQYDRRIEKYRISAASYKKLIIQLKQQRQGFKDLVRKYKVLELSLRQKIVARQHQEKALTAWIKNEMLGVVSLPTGAGKTILSVLAISYLKRSTLIVVPTIDLLNQWYEVLSYNLNCQIGRLGGGFKDYQEIMVSTYDSARMMIESKGNLFGLLVIDECHHLPATNNRFIPQAAIAPFRLGLSATIERPDGGEEFLYNLMGEKIYEASISAMVSKVLAPYDIIKIEVNLNATERQKYQQSRKTYLDFIKHNRIPLGQKNGWQQFIIRASRSHKGRLALQAHREQKKIAQRSQEKITKIWDLLQKHAFDPILIFTDDNEMAYKIGKTFLLPVLTHQTKAKERSDFLKFFRNETIKVLVTSRVLNEGVDVPAARVAIVVSGTGAVREHVQRLGRILRNAPGKRAVLYEIISKDTNETYVNNRRKQHDAYQKPSSL
jgi:superfamily II DNA or RNA helicase